MKKIYRAAALGAALIGLAGPAMAAPPTVVPSPGYDAWLQEQRAASQAAATPKLAYAPRRKPKPHHGVPR
jgi:heme/copper-type cytochrome/quinol oxidase subunit 2